MHIVLRADLTNWVHLIEFCQELFLLTFMNNVREACLTEFNLALKAIFFVFTTKINIQRNTNYLSRVYFMSCYFLENVAEISIVASSITLFYLLIITVHMTQA